MQDNRLIVGFYFEPHVWICKDGEQINAKDITPEQCVEVIFTKALPDEIEICAQRQGFLVAAFPEELLSISMSEIRSGNLLPMNAALFAVDFFNTFLFLLYDQTYKFYNQKYQSIGQAVNVSSLWRWESKSGVDLALLAREQPMPILNQHEILSMDTAPYFMSKSIGQLTENDKLFRGTQSTVILDQVFEIMFVNHDYRFSWQLIALLNKALWSIQKAEFAEAHILSWSVAEKLIGIEWDSFIDSTNGPVGDKGEKTVNRKRKDQLNSPDYEASKRIEILELAKVLPFDLYKRLHDARKTRNKWIHNLENVGQEECKQCYIVARDMLSRRLKYNLEHPGSFYIQDEHVPVSL